MFGANPGIFWSLACHRRLQKVGIQRIQLPTLWWARGFWHSHLCAWIPSQGWLDSVARSGKWRMRENPLKMEPVHWPICLPSVQMFSENRLSMAEFTWNLYPFQRFLWRRSSACTCAQVPPICLHMGPSSPNLSWQSERILRKIRKNNMRSGKSLLSS